MSVEIMSKVFNESKTTGNARVVLLVLADFSNSDAVCWPSVSKIAKNANLSVPSTRKYIAALRVEEI